MGDAKSVIKVSAPSRVYRNYAMIAPVFHGLAHGLNEWGPLFLFLKAWDYKALHLIWCYTQAATLKLIGAEALEVIYAS